MNFDKAKSQLEEAKAALLDQQKKLVLAKNDLQAARPKVQEAYDGLTDVLAQRQADQATADEVEEARRNFEKSQKDLEEKKLALDVTEKALPLFAQKLETARSAFRDPAFDHYRAEAKPLIDEMLKALNNLEEIEEKMQELRTEMDEVKISSGNYLPSTIEAFKLNHLKHDHSVDQYRLKLNELIS